MNGNRHLSVNSRRLLLGAFLFYLFGLIGYLGPSHKHGADPSHSHSDSGCQLCQLTAQPFVAPDSAACPEPLIARAPAVQTEREARIAPRHQPFSSRAPPAA